MKARKTAFLKNKNRRRKKLSFKIQNYLNPTPASLLTLPVFSFLSSNTLRCHRRCRLITLMENTKKNENRKNLGRTVDRSPHPTLTFNKITTISKGQSFPRNSRPLQKKSPRN